jgi:hypothetical protein
MSFVQRQVAHCDVCGHEWLTDKVPSHCAKCKSRRWNQGPVKESRSAKHLLDYHAHDSKTCRIYKCGMCAAIKDR